MGYPDRGKGTRLAVQKFQIRNRDFWVFNVVVVVVVVAVAVVIVVVVIVVVVVVVVDNSVSAT